MAQHIYVVSRVKGRDPLWQLSEEDFQRLKTKIGEIRKAAGGEQLARMTTGTSFILVTRYPDVDAYHKWLVELSPQNLNAQRFWDIEDTIGFEPAGPATRGQLTIG